VPPITPPNNFINTFADGTPLPGVSVLGLPANFGSITPITDRGVISNGPTPTTAAVPGVQVEGWFADDPTHQARFVLRFPDDWNGKLVVAGASGTRSEFNGDFSWSDFALQKGYAYASQNKGVLNLQLSTAADPLACRLNPTTGAGTYVNFYDNGPGQPFGRWQEYMLKAGALARMGVAAHYGWPARYTYAVGTSNGGYQVRRAVELAPQLFDGGVDWEGTFVDERGPNLLTDLPPAVLNLPDYNASGMSAASTAAKNILAAGYPPDIPLGATSLWNTYAASFWEVTLCQWQKRLDPGYDTYGAGLGSYNYIARQAVSDVAGEMAKFATTGRIQRPLVTVAGTLDALLPIDHHAREYARRVDDERQGDDGRRGFGDHRRAPAYRLYEVQNGNHIETYQDAFPQLELIERHAHAAFDALVAHVERNVPLPPDQCVPRGGSIGAQPVAPGHCASLLVP
jgi:hypothetical protein